MLNIYFDQHKWSSTRFRKKKRNREGTSYKKDTYTYYSEDVLSDKYAYFNFFFVLKIIVNKLITRLHEVLKLHNIFRIWFL